MQDAELSQVLETNVRSPPNLLKGGNPYLLFYLCKSLCEKNSTKCRSLICHIFFIKVGLLILGNVLLILVLIIKSCSLKITKFTNFSFPLAVLALTCIGLEERGFGKDSTTWFFPNYSNLTVCLTLTFMYLKARLLVSFHAAGTFWLSCHG